MKVGTFDFTTSNCCVTISVSPCLGMCHEQLCVSYHLFESVCSGFFLPSQSGSPSHILKISCHMPGIFVAFLCFHSIYSLCEFLLSLILFVRCIVLLFLPFNSIKYFINFCGFYECYLCSLCLNCYVKVQIVCFLSLWYQLWFPAGSPSISGAVIRKALVTIYIQLIILLVAYSSLPPAAVLCLMPYGYLPRVLSSLLCQSLIHTAISLSLLVHHLSTVLGSCSPLYAMTFAMLAGIAGLHFACWDSMSSFALACWDSMSGFPGL